MIRAAIAHTFSNMDTAHAFVKTRERASRLTGTRAGTVTRKDFVELAREAAAHRGRIDQSGSLEGIVLHTERRLVTRAGAIAFLRWQALMFDGTWDTKELEDCAYYFRRVDLV
jgi:hypothetical protein